MSISSSFESLKEILKSSIQPEQTNSVFEYTKQLSE